MKIHWKKIYFCTKKNQILPGTTQIVCFLLVYCSECCKFYQVINHVSGHGHSISVLSLSWQSSFTCLFERWFCMKDHSVFKSIENSLVQKWPFPTNEQTMNWLMNKTMLKPIVLCPIFKIVTTLMDWLNQTFWDKH